MIKKDLSRITFDATEKNVMSIINLVWEMEKTANSSQQQVIKKYTQGMCNDLTSLINYFIPESQVGLIVTFEDNGVEYRAYHFMIKLPISDQEPTKYNYYDINGKWSEDQIKPYCAKILNNVTPDDVFVCGANFALSKRPRTNDMVINRCVELIERHPNIVINNLASQSAPTRK